MKDVNISAPTLSLTGYPSHVVLVDGHVRFEQHREDCVTHVSYELQFPRVRSGVRILLAVRRHLPMLRVGARPARSEVNVHLRQTKRFRRSREVKQTSERAAR